MTNTHIPKIIHIAWNTKDILEKKHVFPKNCIQNVCNLAPDWTPVISDDDDIEQYLKDKLDCSDYFLLKKKHIVEKVDVWRLLKIYYEGGLYTDVDRLCNVSINSLINENTRCVLPTCADHDFSQDFMCSSPGNPIYLETLKLNLERRYQGVTDIYLLGPQTYMHGVTKTLFGEMIPASPGVETFNQIRNYLNSVGFVTTYREDTHFNTIMYRPENKQIDFDFLEMKKDFYWKCGLKHWDGDW